ncbi:MAG: carboxypeptidase regulatory-like domain-containing protein, partial [Planctomycetes bacterium]|nr:carboxypeptidase regulatory-like domain-containing protein [Planctomycetota bacterium]
MPRQPLFLLAAFAAIAGVVYSVRLYVRADEPISRSARWVEREEEPTIDLSPAAAIVGATTHSPWERSNAPIRGRVVDIDGSPLEGATIVARPARRPLSGSTVVEVARAWWAESDRREEARRETVSGPDGTFELNDLWRTGYDLEAGHPTCALTVSDAQLLPAWPGSFVRFVEEEGAPYILRLDVRAADGSIPQRAEIRVSPVDRGEGFVANPWRSISWKKIWNDPQLVHFDRGRGFPWSPSHAEFTVSYDAKLTAHFPDGSRSDPVEVTIAEPRSSLTLRADELSGIALEVDYPPGSEARTTHISIMKIDPANPPTRGRFERGASHREVFGELPPVTELPEGDYMVGITVGDPTRESFRWKSWRTRTVRVDSTEIVRVGRGVTPVHFALSPPDARAGIIARVRGGGELLGGVRFACLRYRDGTPRGTLGLLARRCEDGSYVLIPTSDDDSV